MGIPALRRYDRSWKVTAGLLGIVALVVASVAVNLDHTRVWAVGPGETGLS